MNSPVKPLDRSFWRNKRVLLTGHTGFKGGWLAFWLQRLGADVVGISLPPHTSPNLFSLLNIEGTCRGNFIDIRDHGALAAMTKEIRPEIVFHLAAQPLVRAGYQRPMETFSTNIMGTVNLLDSIRDLDSVRVAIIITTDKVYQNREWPWPYRESDPLGGHDPYNSSKAAAEIVVDGFRNAFLAEQGVAIASARAGNVIGGGDWSEDRLIPDAVRAWENGQTLEVRRPSAIRPWQHVLEPLSGYLDLAQRLDSDASLSGAYNFGPNPGEAASVREVVELARDAYGKGEARFAERIEGPHEADMLSLEIAKARAILGFNPHWTLPDAVARTMAWYRAQAGGADARDLCAADIETYEAES